MPHLQLLLLAVTSLTCPTNGTWGWSYWCKARQKQQHRTCTRRLLQQRMQRSKQTSGTCCFLRASPAGPITSRLARQAILPSAAAALQDTVQQEARPHSSACLRTKNPAAAAAAGAGPLLQALLPATSSRWRQHSTRHNCWPQLVLMSCRPAGWVACCGSGRS